MSVTITSKSISDDQNYVLLTLSDGTDIAIDVSWSTKYVTDDQGNVVNGTDGNPLSLLQYEIDQSVILAQSRADAAAASLAAAEQIVNG